MVLLTCALQACSPGELVVTPEGELEPVTEPSQPAARPAVSACDCSALPAVDSRIPWSEGWESIAYRPGGGGVALLGPSSIFSYPEMRDTPVSPDSPLRSLEVGLHLFLWDADGSVRSVPPPDDLQGEITTEAYDGCWSPDGAHYAARFGIERPDGHHSLVGLVVAVCDTGSGEWVSNLSLGWAGTSGVSWDPTGREIALLGRDARWQDLQMRRSGAASADERVMLLVCDIEGRVIRSTPFEPKAGRSGSPCWLGWSPDGHFLATVTKPAMDERGSELHVFDAATLAQLDSRRMPDWDGPQGYSRPQWSRDSRRLAIPLYSGVGLVTLDNAGHLASKSLLSLENQLVQFAWCPDGVRLFVLQQVRVHDFIEFLGALDFKDCQNSDTLYRAVPRFIDPESGTGFDCDDLVQSRRTDYWNRCWSIPRVGEAFALWTR